MKDLFSLVGLPWHDADCNCLTLAARAQKDLWGRNVDVSFVPPYSPSEFLISVDDLSVHLAKYADVIPNPVMGAVGIFKSCDCAHLATFVTMDAVLYILVGKLSRISRYHRGWQNRMASIWRLRR